MLTRFTSSIRFFSKSSSIFEKMKYLFVAEKNDAAKTISQILSHGNSRRREGLSQYNKIYEWDMNIRGQNATILFTSVSGHMQNFDFIGSYRQWQGCNPEQLFEAPIHKMCTERSEKIKRTLEREVKTCQAIVIWTDCDREGENIGFEIINVCRVVKPAITVYRARFSDMTAASINRAVNNLANPDERVSQAVDVRQELDLRIGAAFTRFQTMRLSNLFPQNLKDDLISYGSCQFPTLGFVTDRYREIEKFIPSNFWKIKMTHVMNNLTVDYNWARNRIFDEACCKAILVILKSINKAIVTSVQQKPKNKWRPKAMDTVELEKTGSRKLKMSAKQIMTIAEKLYTQGLISYPRTETNQFSKDMNLRPLVEMQTVHPLWGDFASKVLTWGPNPKNGNKSDQAHPPIHPTKFTNSLTGDEKKVYELVVRHFLACISRDAVGSETLVQVQIGEEEFNATGLVVLERNYLEVYIYEKWTGKEIHNYQIGNTFVPDVLDLHEGQTSPPSLLTEADLIALMEKHEIGTDATHAEHIATVKERGYIGVIEGGFLVPGTLGMGLVEGYELMNLTLSRPQLRAGLEVDLKAICEGKKNPAEVLRQQLQIYKQCYQVVIREVAQLDRAVGNRFNAQPQNPPSNVSNIIPTTTVHNLFKCPKCQTSSVIVRQKKDNSGSFLSCQGYPACKHAIWLNSMKHISSLDEKCASCGGENHKVKIKFSQPHMFSMIDETAYSRIEEGHYITCFYCDGKLRDALYVKTEDVKVLGNIIAASSNPVHHPQQQQFNNGINHNNNGQSGQSRNFGTSFGSFNSNNRRNWFGNTSNDNNDDDNNSGGGGGAIATTSNHSKFNDAKRDNQTLSNLPNIFCTCKLIAKKFMCKKDGPNQNRAFYKCNHGQCKFFQWADTLPANVQIAPQVNSNQRRCSLCKNVGHNKKNCPLNSNNL